MPRPTSLSSSQRPLHAVLCALLAILSLALGASAAVAAQVVAPDNGFGTATLPPAGENYDGSQMQIVDGLLPGSTVDINAPVLGSFSSVTEVPGGGFAGGTQSSYDAVLVMPMVGTGAMAGYFRTINIPLNGAGANLMDFDARVLSTSPQSFAGDLRRLQGQILGDPDFDLLRITAGTEFGLPSPGHTTLTDLGGGNWNVDSFFDITYRIDFVGSPGGIFSGMSGSTTGTAIFQMGTQIPEPSTFVLGIAGLAVVGLAALRKNARRDRLAN